MHIGIDALFRLPEGGGRTVLRELLRAWLAEAKGTGDTFSVFTTPEGAAVLREMADGSPTLNLHVFSTPGRSTLLRLIWEQTIFLRVLSHVRPDVLFCPGNAIPLRTQIPTVVLLHNALPFCQPNRANASPLFAFRLHLIGWLMRKSAVRADAVISVSAAILDALHLAAPPARVIGLGVEPLPIAVHEPLPFPYLLYVSGIWPYKNMREVIAAFARLLNDDPTLEWRLVFAGGIFDQGYFDDLQRLAAKLGIAERVIFTGALPRAEVGALLAGALALVHASTCESFGLPLVEALAAGIPIACSDAPFAHTIVGGDALFFDPSDPTGIAAQLTRLRDPALRRQLGAAGIARAATFGDWRSVADQMRAVLAEIAVLPQNKSATQ